MSQEEQKKKKTESRVISCFTGRTGLSGGERSNAKGFETDKSLLHCTMCFPMFMKKGQSHSGLKMKICNSS